MSRSSPPEVFYEGLNHMCFPVKLLKLFKKAIFENSRDQQKKVNTVLGFKLYNIIVLWNCTI